MSSFDWDDTERYVLKTENELFVSHEFRYIKVGYKTLPFWEEVGTLAKKLTHGLHDHCLILRIGEEAAKERIAVSGRF